MIRQHVNPLRDLTVFVENGQTERANWLMCRLPAQDRADQLAAWQRKRPGFFEGAKAYHEAQRRQIQAEEETPSFWRHRRRS